jgi:hypothetical protein
MRIFTAPIPVSLISGTTVILCGRYAVVYLLSMHCLQEHHFIVLIAAKIFKENFLIDD